MKKNGLFYLAKGSGPNVVLLHGNGESHEIFTELLDELAADFYVVSIDSPGHGASHEVENYDFEEMAAEIADLLRSILTDPALIFGFSDGGILALILALEHRDVVAGIIPCGANTYPDGVLDVFTAEIKNHFAANPNNKLVELMLTQPNITDESLQTIAVPTWVLAGEEDLIKPEHTENIHKQIAGSRLTILAGEDHGSYIEHSTKSAPFIRELAAEIWPD